MRLTNTANVRTVASVNLDSLVVVNEQRHTNSGTSLNSGRLECVGGSVALDAWLGVSDFELGLDWHFCIEHRVG